MGYIFESATKVNALLLIVTDFQPFISSPDPKTPRELIGLALVSHMSSVASALSSSYKYSNDICSETPWPVETKEGKKNPQKAAQFRRRSHPKHLVRKRTAQKDTTKNITFIYKKKTHLSSHPLWYFIIFY